MPTWLANVEMNTFFSQLLTLPTFESEEENRIAKLLLAIIGLGILISPLSFIFVLLFTDEIVAPILSAITTMNLFIEFRFLKQGKLRVVSTILILHTYLVIMALMSVKDGIRHEVLPMVQLLLILTATFLGRRATGWLGSLAILNIIMLFVAELAGWVVTKNFVNPPSADSLLVILLSIGLTTTMLRLIVDQIVKKGRLLQQQATILQTKNTLLENTHSELEERTHDLSDTLIKLESKNITLQNYREHLEELVAQRTETLSQTIIRSSSHTRGVVGC